MIIVVVVVVVVVVVLVEVWNFPYLRFVGEKEEKEEVPVPKKPMVGGWISSSQALANILEN